jgi:pimeloyl-ACP methyl ester carboxylesterase
VHPDLPSNAETQYIDMAGGRVAYTDEGSGPTLICIHGMPASGRDFRWLESALGPNLRVISLDLPGFGDTPRVMHPPLDMDGMAKFIWQFFDAMQIEKAALLGHSMGGVVATHAATDNRVRALALVSSAGPFPHRGYYPKTCRLLAPFSRHWTTRWLIIALMRQAMALSGFPKDFSNENVVATLQGAANIRLDQHGKTLQSLNKPTFVAWADDDQMVESKVSEAVAAIAPVGPRLHFDKGGHNIQKTRAIEIAEKLCPWMHECAGLKLHEKG